MQKKIIWPLVEHNILKHIFLQEIATFDDFFFFKVQ